MVLQSKKIYNMYISIFRGKSRSSRNYFSNMKTKVVTSDSRKVNGAQCCHSRVVHSSQKKIFETLCLIS